MRVQQPSSVRRHGRLAAWIAAEIWLTEFAIVMGFGLAGHYPHPLEAAMRRSAMAGVGGLLFWATFRLLDRMASGRSSRRLLAAIMLVIGGSIGWSVAAFAIVHFPAGNDTAAEQNIGAARELALNAVAVAGLFGAWVVLCIALGYRRDLAEAHLKWTRAGLAATPARSYLWVPTAHGHTRLLLDDIEYFEADHDYVRVHSGTGRHLLHSTLRKLHDELAPQGFVRVHRSFVVNIRKVIQLHRRGGGLLELCLSSGARIPVGRSHSVTVRGWLELRDDTFENNDAGCEA